MCFSSSQAKVVKASNEVIGCVGGCVGDNAILLHVIAQKLQNT